MKKHWKPLLHFILLAAFVGSSNVWAKSATADSSDASAKSALVDLPDTSVNLKLRRPLHRPPFHRPPFHRPPVCRRNCGPSPH